MNIFEQAVRQGIRFSIGKGDITTEDLWDLPLTSEKGISLDSIAIALKTELDQHKVISFVKPQTSKTALIELKLEVVKHIITTIMKEREEARNKANVEAEKQRYKEIIADKKDEALKQMPVEELEKRLAEM